MASDRTMREPSAELRADVLSKDFIIEKAPFMGRHPRLLDRVMRLFSIDKVNALHAHNYLKPTGAEVAAGMLEDLRITLDARHAERLDRLPERAFITVSNHPFGAIEGIMIMALIGGHRPDFKVMVNDTLRLITAFKDEFIGVDALASDDPAKKAISMQGIKQSILHVRRGHPLGFFPAGAVSKLNGKFRLEDRAWQPSVSRLIMQLGVPVVPVFFHGSNSAWFNILGKISWQLRTLRLPAEVFNKIGKTMSITVGETVTPEELKAHDGDPEEFGRWLKSLTYALADK